MAKLSDTMITSGPLNNRSLLGSAIKIKNHKPPPTEYQLTLVRILFYCQSRLEDLMFPISQCNSWFVSFHFIMAIVHLAAEPVRDYSTRSSKFLNTSATKRYQRSLMRVSRVARRTKITGSQLRHRISHQMMRGQQTWPINQSQETKLNPAPSI